MPPQTPIQMPYGIQHLPPIAQVPPYFAVPMRMPPMFMRHTHPINTPFPNRMPPYVTRRFRHSSRPFHRRTNVITNVQ